MARCPDCDGPKVFGSGGDGKCDVCHGTGYGNPGSQFAAAISGGESKCYKCGGSGDCETCGGSGEVD
jgi:hypothetical protein